jgi:hypothetical protein
LAEEAAEKVPARLSAFVWKSVLICFRLQRWMWTAASRLQGELNLERSGDLLEIRVGQLAESVDEPTLADRGQLVRHRLPLLAPDVDVGLARVQPRDDC